MRDRSGQGLSHDQPGRVLSLKVWYSRVADWTALEAFASLQTLEVAGYEHSDLEPVSSLCHLKELRLLHFPKVSNLSPLAKLSALENLALEFLPSYDASGKYLHVESLSPLAQLPKLRQLRIFGVRASDRSLHALSQITSLSTIHIGRGFAAAEYAALRSAHPAAVCHFPEASRG
jgi:hypothetical protein